MARAKHAAAFWKKYDAAGPAQKRRDALCAEITGADKLGIWITVDGAPYFVAHEKTGWLRDPAVLRMLNMTLLNGFHLRFESLDAEIDVDAL